MQLSVADARQLSERALRGIGYDPEEARIIADHVIDAALCGYEYSGLAKILNIPEHRRFERCHPGLQPEDGLGPEYADGIFHRFRSRSRRLSAICLLSGIDKYMEHASKSPLLYE